MILTYQVTSFNEQREPATTECANREQVANMVEDRLLAGDTILITQQSKEER